MQIKRTEDLKKGIASGSQRKWFIDGAYYKADTKYHEGLAECITSRIMTRSNIGRHFIYRPELLLIGNEKIPGCKSPNGLNDDERLVDTHFLLSQHDVYHYTFKEISANPTKYIREYINIIEKITDLTFDKYLTRILEMDELTLNEDRSLKNIAVIRRKMEDEYEYTLAPVFDNGRCFALEDRYINDWSKGTPIDEIAFGIEALPFSFSHQEQAEISAHISGTQFLTSFTKEDLKEILDECAGLYDETTLRYAEEMVLHQMKRCGKYFLSEKRELWKKNILKVLQSIGIKGMAENENILIKHEGFNIQVLPTGDISIFRKKYLEWTDISGNPDMFAFCKEIAFIATKYKL